MKTDSCSYPRHSAWGEEFLDLSGPQDDDGTTRDDDGSRLRDNDSFGLRGGRKLLFVPCLALVICSLAVASNALAKPYKLSGIASLGVDYKERFKKLKEFGVAELDIESKRRSGVKGGFEFIAELDSQVVTVQDLFINYKFDTDDKIEFSHRNRIIGREYELSRKKRRTLKRTLIYDHLAALGYAGRAYQLSFRSDPKEEGASYGATLSGLSAVLHGGFRQEKSLSFGVWAFSYHDRKGDQTQADRKAGLLSLWGPVMGIGLFEIEIAGGEDPDATEVSELFGQDETVLFAGGKILYGAEWDLDDELALRPSVSISHLNEDLKRKLLLTEGIVAIDLRGEEFRVSANVNVTAKKGIDTSADRSYSRSRMILEFTKYF